MRVKARLARIMLTVKCCMRREEARVKVRLAGIMLTVKCCICRGEERVAVGAHTRGVGCVSCVHSVDGRPVNQ